MCYRVTERYSVCRCIYYKHQISFCGASGTEGHLVQTKDILVGYLCGTHSNQQDSFLWSSSLGSSRPKTPDKTGPQKSLTVPQGVRITSNTALKALEDVQLKLRGVLDYSYNLEDLRSRLLYPSRYITSLQELEKKSLQQRNNLPNTTPFPNALYSIPNCTF